MTQPEKFSAYRFPVVDNDALTCIGVQLTDDTEAWLHSAAPFVTAAENAKAQRFAHPIDAVRHLVGRALVRRTLSATLQQPISADFSYTQWGKPFWPDDSIHFSIAHSGNMVWTAFCRNDTVGIDVEEMRPIPDIQEMATLLHPEECRAIHAQQPSERDITFYRCWTRKEAVLKATGKGLNQPLNSFQVHTGQTETDWIISLPEETDTGRTAPPCTQALSRGAQSICSRWKTRDLAVGKGYHCSLAACTQNTTIKIFTINNER